MKVKRLISKPETVAVINDIKKTAATPVGIYSEAGELLWGDAVERPVSRHEIKAQGKLLGWISAAQDVPALNSFLNYVVAKEELINRLADETLERYKEIAMYTGVIEKITTSLGVEEIARLAIQEAQNMTAATGGALMLWDKKSNKFRVLSTFGTEELAVGQERNVAGVSGSVLQKRKAEIVNDLRADSRDAALGSKVRSLMCAPLKSGQDVIGILRVSSVNPMEFSAGELNMLVSLASATGMAIQNASFYAELKQTLMSIVQVLVQAVEIKDPHTSGHSKRVAHYSILIGKKLGLSPARLARLKLAALLHDIGKIGIDDEILKQPNLSLPDQESIKKHSQYGADLLNHIKEIRDIVPAVRAHHERFDGKGFPDGIKGEDIPLFARIIAVADSFDSICDGHEQDSYIVSQNALQSLQARSSTELDPEIVRVFCQALNDQDQVGSSS
jgi:putative nucleotidyltransferase with HDIG domain